MVAEVLKLMGRAVSFGHAIGPAFILKRHSLVVPEFTILASQVPGEWARFEKACREAERQLVECKTQVENGSKMNGEGIFDIQIALLHDSCILRELKQTLQCTLKNIETCLVDVIDKCLQKICKKELLPVCRHYGDLQDVRKRLLCILTENISKRNIVCEKGSICVAEDIEPSDVWELKNAGISGVVLEYECATSHAIILAKSLHIPILIGVKDACSQIKEGEIIEVDGEHGICWLGRKGMSSSVTETLSLPDKIALDDQAIYFYVSQEENPSHFLGESAVSGIGLVRTEMLFLNREDFPGEDEQFLFYKRIVISANGKPVVLRTLDVGSDKLPKHSLLQEANPFLGLRGIRYCLKNEKMFRQQILAILRASALGCVKILYPMVSDTGELVRANELLEDCKRVLSGRGVPFDSSIKIGVMLETPSAVLCMKDLAQYCDFFSIGTNDLTQYTLAVDRTNPAVANLYQMTHPAVFRCLQFISEQAKMLSREIWVCGELPNEVVPFLMCLSLGYRSFVVGDNSIPYLAHLCGKMNLTKLESLASEAQNKTSSVEIFAVFEKYYKSF